MGATNPTGFSFYFLGGILLWISTKLENYLSMLRNKGYSEEDARSQTEQIMITVGKVYDRNDLCCSSFEKIDFRHLL